MTVSVTSALLATANAAAAAVADGAKNAAFCGAIASGIGSGYKLVARRSGVVVLTITMSGSMLAAGGGLSVPDEYGSLDLLTAADIDSGTWTLRIEKASDAAVYLEGTLGRSGADFTLSDDLDVEKGIAISSLFLNSPALDTPPAGADVDDIIADMRTTLASPRNSNSYLRMIDGLSLYNSYGGGASQAKITSFKSIEDSLAGHNQYMVNNFAANVQFLTINVLAGHTAVNTCIEMRKGFCAVLKADNTWAFAYKNAAFWGKRLYNGNLAYDLPGTQTKISGGILRVQPGPAIAMPGEANATRAGYEVWPSNWDNSGITSFYGAINRSLYAQAKCFVLGVQMRLQLWNPAGTDDRASAFIVAQTGFDSYSNPHPGHRYISDGGALSNTLGEGYPYGAFDGSFGPWKRITSNDWQWLYCATVADICAAPAGKPPPWGNYTQPWPWNAISTYSISEATLRANPPPDPLA